jgi:hypothetical protein
MRVDDVAGTWGRYGQTPLAWARAAARNGFLPWPGLFLYNLDDAAIAEVREMLETGRATAFPHALGRPPRKPDDTWFYAAADKQFVATHRRRILAEPRRCVNP